VDWSKDTCGATKLTVDISAITGNSQARKQVLEPEEAVE
jgi:hypothetical protein